MFSLTEYEAAFNTFFSEAVQQVAVRGSGLLRDLRTERLDYLPAARVTVEGGLEVTTAGVTMEMRFALANSDILESNTDAVAAAISEAAGQMQEQMEKALLSYVGEVVDATGNVVDAQGAQLSWDLILDAVEKVQLSFDEQGNPRLPTLVLHPSQRAKLEALPPPTPQQEERRSRIMREKKDQYLARRRHRRLP